MNKDEIQTKILLLHNNSLILIHLRKSPVESKSVLNIHLLWVCHSGHRPTSTEKGARSLINPQIQVETKSLHPKDHLSNRKGSHTNPLVPLSRVLEMHCVPKHNSLATHQVSQLVPGSFPIDSFPIDQRTMVLTVDRDFINLASAVTLELAIQRHGTLNSRGTRTRLT